MNVIVIYYKVLDALLVPVDVYQSSHEHTLRTVSVLAYSYVQPHLRRKYYKIDIPGTSLQSKHDPTLFRPFVYDNKSPSKRSINPISSVLSPSRAKLSAASFYIDYIITKDFVISIQILFISTISLTTHLNTHSSPKGLFSLTLLYYLFSYCYGSFASVSSESSAKITEGLFF